MPSYFIRQNGAAVPQGPYPEERLREWVAAGRVRVDMDFSEDGETWVPGRRLLSIFPPASPSAATAPPAERRVAARDAADRRARRMNIAAACVGLVLVGAAAWYFLGRGDGEDGKRDPGATTDGRPAVSPAMTAADAAAAAAKKAADEQRDRDFAAAEALLAAGDLDRARAAFVALRDQRDDLRVADAMSRLHRAIDARDRAREAEEAAKRMAELDVAAKKKAEERAAAEAAAKEKAEREAAEAKKRSGESTKKDVDDLATRLRGAVAAGDGAARDLWMRLRAQSKDDPALAETEPALGRLPYPAGTWIPSDARAPGLRDHYALPEADGITVVVANGATIRLRVAASGLSATAERTAGKDAVKGEDRVMGLRWSPDRPEPVLVADARKRLGTRGPPADRYEADVRWLPGDFVAFGSEVWSVASAKSRGGYHAGTSAWADAFFQPPLAGPNAVQGINDRRTRIARGSEHYDGVAFLTDRTGLAFAWLERGSLKGKALGVLPIATTEGPTVPFDFVPWGKEKRPVLCVIAIGRIPTLVELTADGVRDVAKGESIADGFSVGAPTWCDLGRRGVREIVAPATDAEGMVGLLVLLSE